MTRHSSRSPSLDGLWCRAVKTSPILHRSTSEAAWCAMGPNQHPRDAGTRRACRPQQTSSSIRTIELPRCTARVQREFISFGLHRLKSACNNALHDTAPPQFALLAVVGIPHRHRIWNTAGTQLIQHCARATHHMLIPSPVEWNGLFRCALHSATSKFQGCKPWTGVKLHTQHNLCRIWWSEDGCSRDGPAVTSRCSTSVTSSLTTTRHKSAETSTRTLDNSTEFELYVSLRPFRRFTLGPIFVHIRFKPFLLTLTR